MNNDRSHSEAQLVQTAVDVDDADTALVHMHLSTQTKLLLRALDRMQATPQYFVFRCWVPTTGGTSSRVTAASRGLLQMIHNPTNAPLFVQLATGATPELTMIAVSIPANGVQIVSMPFYSPLHVLAGNGAIITGTVYE